MGHWLEVPCASGASSILLDEGYTSRVAGQKVLPDRSAELAKNEKLPEVAEHEAVGAFFVEKALVVGEWAQGIEMNARPGVWFAYFLDHEDPPDDGEEDDYPPSRLVCIHSESVGAFAKLQEALKQESEELPIEGASMAAADAEAAKDKSFQRALEYAGHEVIQGRGVQVRIGGDGRGVARVAREEEAAVLISIDLM